MSDAEGQVTKEGFARGKMAMGTDCPAGLVYMWCQEGIARCFVVGDDGGCVVDGSVSVSERCCRLLSQPSSVEEASRGV